MSIRSVCKVDIEFKQINRNIFKSVNILYHVWQQLKQLSLVETITFIYQKFYFII